MRRWLRGARGAGLGAFTEREEEGRSARGEWAEGRARASEAAPAAGSLLAAEFERDGADWEQWAAIEFEAPRKGAGAGEALAWALEGLLSMEPSGWGGRAAARCGFGAAWPWGIAGGGLAALGERSREGGAAREALLGRQGRFGALRAGLEARELADGRMRLLMGVKVKAGAGGLAGRSLWALAWRLGGRRACARALESIAARGWAG